MASIASELGWSLGHLEGAPRILGEPKRFWTHPTGAKCGRVPAVSYRLGAFWWQVIARNGAVGFEKPLG